MIRIVLNNTIDIRTVKDNVFSSNKGTKTWYLFGMRFLTKEYDEKFGNIQLEEEELPKPTIGFKEKK